MRASGSFEVNLELQDDAEIGDPSISRRSIDKTFTGDLEARSRGQMLAIMGEEQGSAGYVAIEKIKGTLLGKTGTFALQHSSTMTRGRPEQNIIVVPDSGTDQLTGLNGRMTINIVDGQHFYDFDFELT